MANVDVTLHEITKHVGQIHIVQASHHASPTVAYNLILTRVPHNTIPVLTEHCQWSVLYWGSVL